MKEKDINEMTSEELIAQIKAEAEAELYGNIDEPIDDKEYLIECKNKADVGFNKFTKLVKKYKKCKKELDTIEAVNTENTALRQYIKLLDDIKKLEADMEDAKKGYLYENAILVPDMEFENTDVKLSVTMPYEKEEFNKAVFVKDYGPETEMYKKYITKKQVKGNVKYKIKE